MRARASGPRDLGLEIASALAPSADEARFLDRLDAARAAHPDNLCARHLSRDLFLSFGPAARARLMGCCRSGVDAPDSQVGAYILRPGDLTEFGALFEPLLRAHHAPPAAPQGVDRGLAGLGLTGLSARVRAGRNLAGFAMPAMMDRAGRVRLERVITPALQGLVDDLGGRVVSLTPGFGGGQANPNLVGAAEYQALVAANLLFRPMTDDPYMRGAGLAGDWPHGRAAYVSADRSLIVWIGEEDHLRVIAMTTGGRLDEASGRVQAVLAIIAAQPGVRFLKDETWGYVTSCPSNLGSGLRPSLRVRLPELTGPGVDTRALCRRFGLAASGPSGDRSAIDPGGPVDLSPIRRLFVEDREILDGLRRGVAGLQRMFQA